MIKKLKYFFNEHYVIAPIITFILCFILILITISYGIYKFNVEMVSANIIKVYVKNDSLVDEFIYLPTEKLIYEGKSAFIQIESGGMTTTVTIYKKLYPIPIIKEIISDKTIRIEGA